MGWIREATFGGDNPYDRPLSKEEQEKLRQKLAKEAAEEAQKKAAADIEWRRQQEEEVRKIDEERARKAETFEELKRQFDNIAVSENTNKTQRDYPTTMKAVYNGKPVEIEVGFCNNYRAVSGEADSPCKLFVLYTLGCELRRLDEIGYQE